jgi:hypothetical protein
MKDNRNTGQYDFEIEDYDGKEWVSEKHRTWC